MESQYKDLIKKAYSAFNARDIGSSFQTSPHFGYSRMI